jgi:signal transduction histidine kinase
MLARLEEASERRRRLTADVAHELNTPIATIASGAEIALRHTRSPEEYQEVLRHTLDESRHMARVVDDLLLLARVEAGRLPLQHELVEIDEICRQTVKALGPLATERRIRLDIDVPATAILVVGDELRLAQVVRNLVDNALRYTPEGGAVQVSLRQKTDIGGSPVVELRVLDTGPGIEIAERDLIFDRFHRATGSDMSGGSGLGLAISKAIVLAHGGDIRVETGNGVDGSYYPGGAQFIVTLPEAGSTYFDA